jgi:hypothetical protein
MKTSVTLIDDKGKELHYTVIVGGFDLGSTVRMAVGRAMFEMKRQADLDWETAIIRVKRWDNV